MSSHKAKDRSEDTRALQAAHGKARRRRDPTGGEESGDRPGEARRRVQGGDPRPPEHVELTPAPQEDVYRRLLHDLRSTTEAALGVDDYLCQPIAELEAVEELLEYRENGGTTAADASLAAVVHGLTARLDLAVKLRAGLWDPDNPHATVLADTKVLPARVGGAQ
jgi:hypothetical protein